MNPSISRSRIVTAESPRTGSPRSALAHAIALACHIASAASCSFELPAPREPAGAVRADPEARLLLDERALSRCSAVAGDDSVDWRLAREFALAELESMIEAGEVAPGARLRPLPVVVFAPSGEPRWWEFRAESADGSVVAAICAETRKSRGMPIAFRLPCPNGYSDAVETLSRSGAIEEGDLLRVVADDYPGYVIAVDASSRALVAPPDDAFDPERGTRVDARVLREPASIDEFVAERPEFRPLLSAELAEARQYRERLEEFWSRVDAERESGSTAQVGRKVVEKSFVPGYESILLPDGAMNGWLCDYCGPTAVNQVLGYMAARGMIAWDPRDRTGFAAIDHAVDRWRHDAPRHPWFHVIEGPTMPWMIPAGVETFAPGYSTLCSGWNAASLAAVVLSFWSLDAVPGVVAVLKDAAEVWSSIRASVDRDGIPGISLRGVRIGARGKGWTPHYRNIVGYRVTEYSFFGAKYREPSMFVHDRNLYDQGLWETYNPLFHWQYYRTTRRG